VAVTDPTPSLFEVCLTLIRFGYCTVHFGAVPRVGPTLIQEFCRVYQPQSLSCQLCCSSLPPRSSVCDLYFGRVVVRVRASGVVNCIGGDPIRFAVRLASRASGVCGIVPVAIPVRFTVREDGCASRLQFVLLASLFEVSLALLMRTPCT
jgi:hypothetical protein